MPGKLFIFSAPSGAGKSTIVQHLIDSDLELSFSISATSRPPRGKEKHGKEYYFLSPEEFQRKIGKNEFLEWEEVYPGTFYGTLRKEVDRIRAIGKHALFDIDVQGGLYLKKEFGSDACAIFVMPPSLEILEERLRSRGTDGEEELRKRLDKAAYEMTFASRFDHIVVNDTMEHALRHSEELVKKYLES